MIAADERISNSGLLSFSNFTQKTKNAFSVVEAIAAERPLRDIFEARECSESLNNILAFVQFGTVVEENLPDNTESVMNGLGEILTACRLVSLRLEQYLDMQPDEPNLKRK